MRLPGRFAYEEILQERERAGLPFFSEVREAEGLGGLILALVAGAGDYEDNKSNHVGDHLVKLLELHVVHGNGQVEIDDIKPAEEEGGPDCPVRAPDREDDESDGEPAAVAEGVVGPYAAGVVHDVEEAAETGYHAADAGREVFIAGNVDAGGVSGGGVFTDRSEMQTHAGAVEDIVHYYCNDDREINEEAELEEEVAEPAAGVCEGQSRLEAQAGVVKGDGGGAGAGELDEGAAEEVAEADAEGGHGKTGDVLVGSQRNRQEAVDKPHYQRAEEAAEQRYRYCEEAVHVLGRGKALFVEERADDAADGANVHDTRNTEVEVSGLLGQDFTRAAVKKRHTPNYGSGYEGKQ